MTDVRTSTPSFRATIGQLLVLIGLSAIGLASMIALNSNVVWMLTAGYFLSLPTGLRIHTARWCPLVLGIAVASAPTGGVDPFGARFVASVGFLLCGVAFLSIPRRRDERLDRRYMALWAACMIAIAAVPFTDWPMVLAFRAVRPQFEGLARRINAGALVQVPFTIGNVTIRGVELRDGRPCLWTDPKPDGPTGFVRNPFAGVAPAERRFGNLDFNLWSGVALDADWALISED